MRSGNVTFARMVSCISHIMDKMLVIPADRPRLRPWMLCLLMGVTALALLQVIALHGHRAPAEITAAVSP